MDFIPGPTVPTRPHIRVPFLCALTNDDDFPNYAHFNFSGPSYFLEKLRNRKVIDRNYPGYYDLRSGLPTGLKLDCSRKNGPGCFRDFPSREYHFADDSFQAQWNSSEYRKVWFSKPAKEMAIFIQDWLYFALLGEVLGRHVNYDEFLAPIHEPSGSEDGNSEHRVFLKDSRGELVLQVSTQLFLHSSEWNSWAQTLSSLPEVERQQRCRNIGHALHQAQKLCLLEDDGGLGEIPFVNGIALSIRVLGLLFESVCHDHPHLFPDMNQSLGTSAWGMGLILRRSLIRSRREHSEDIDLKYCPNTMARLQKILPASALYYMSTANIAKSGGSKAGLLPCPSNEKGKTHSECTSKSCIFDNIDPNTYVTEHNPCCDGKCGYVGPDMTQVADILGRGKIPLICFAPADPKKGIFTRMTEDRKCYEQRKRNAYGRVVKQTEQILEQTEQILEQTEQIIEQTEPIIEQTEPIIEQTEPIIQQTLKKFGLSEPHITDDAFRALGIAELDWSFTVMEYEPETKTPFIAISHVWSDGLGNRVENKLPRCRMPFIQRAIWQCRAPLTFSPVEVRDERHHPTFGDQDSWAFVDDRGRHNLLCKDIMPFWLDTFCVPRTSREGRTDALRLMKDTYTLAEKVLVFDQQLCGTNIGGHSYSRKFRLLSNTAIAGLILQSKWMRRLWTLQEGLCAKTLLFLFAEGPADIQGVLDGINQDADASQPGNRIARQLALGLESMISCPQNKIRISFPPDQDGGNALCRLTLDNYDRLVSVWNSSVGRTSSLVGDVPLCIGSCISLNVSRLRSEDIMTRTVNFYQMLREIPQSIVFSGRPKLALPGLRWADEQIAQSPLSTSAQRGHIVGDTYLTAGLTVTYPAYSAKLDINAECTYLLTNRGNTLRLRKRMYFYDVEEGLRTYDFMMDRPCEYVGDVPMNPIRVVIMEAVHPGVDIKIIRAYSFLDLVEQKEEEEMATKTLLVDLGVQTWLLN